MPSRPGKRRDGFPGISRQRRALDQLDDLHQRIGTRPRIQCSWLQGRQHAKRLAEIDATNRESKALSAQARDAMSDVSARLGQLEARMFETQNQRMALESLYREFSRGRDEWVLAEVEQALLIANQQLQLAGNVKAALIAMETADARLARVVQLELDRLEVEHGRTFREGLTRGYRESQCSANVLTRNCIPFLAASRLSSRNRGVRSCGRHQEGF